MSTKIQQKFDERFLLFCENKNNQLLDLHKLTGQYLGKYSIDITGDYRAIFEHVGDDSVQFLRIGTHNQLYK